jgi:hypothetical protein
MLLLLMCVAITFWVVIWSFNVHSERWSQYSGNQDSFLRASDFNDASALRKDTSQAMWNRKLNVLMH